MKTSARNQWVGTVSAIRAGAVNDEVELSLPGGARLWAIVTRESTEALALQLQQTVIALVKSSSVMLATGLGDAKLSARNRFDGRVSAVKPGDLTAKKPCRSLTWQGFFWLPCGGRRPTRQTHMWSIIT